MKTLFFIFILASTFSFSQDKLFLAKVEKSSEFAENKTKGEFNFIFQKQVTKEQIETNASYYKSFFTVSFDEKKHLVSIKMLTNDEKSRRVLVRFFVTSKISQIDMDGVSYKPEEFYNKHIK
ncbi:MAG: hypothetical protein V4622_08180 [Bacteroidota bacterium]